MNGIGCGTSTFMNLLVKLEGLFARSQYRATLLRQINKNRMFESNQKRVVEELAGERSDNEI